MKCAVIYMAAGNSRRFSVGIKADRGEASSVQDRNKIFPKQDNEKSKTSLERNKLLHSLEGRPLYRHGLNTAAEVVGRHSGSVLLVITQYLEIYREVEQLGIPVFLNEDSRLGASCTVRRGLEEAAALGEFDYFLFMAGDQPYLQKETLEEFFARGEEGQYAMVSASFGERLGNPVMFRSDLYPDLLELKGDEGGRKVWRQYAGGRLPTALVQAAQEKELKDFDFPEDFWEEQPPFCEKNGCFFAKTFDRN